MTDSDRTGPRRGVGWGLLVLVTLGFAGVSSPDARADATGGSSRCSYFVTPPDAFGRQTYLLARATSRSSLAPSDSTSLRRPRPVPAQEMKVTDVAGFRSEEIRRGLRASRGRALFVRYGVDMGCAPWPEADGGFDSAGVGGLYVGVPRPSAQWIDGRPTFDVFRAAHFPLPGGSGRSTGHLTMTRVDSAPVMTAREQFALYRGLWTEQVELDDSTFIRRIRSWMREHPASVRKAPARAVIDEIIELQLKARVEAVPIPFGGTFAAVVVVPGVDSAVMLVRTSARARPWEIDPVDDSATTLPLGARLRTIGIDIFTTWSDSASGPDERWPSPRTWAVVTTSPTIALRADSTWTCRVHPAGFLENAPSGSMLRKLTSREAMRELRTEEIDIVFRQHADGSVTFEARMPKYGTHEIRVRGERVSKVTNDVTS